MSIPRDLFGGAYDGRRVFVTGHTGFKGSWLCEWLLGLGAEVSGYALEPPTQPNLFDELGLASRMRSTIADVRDGLALCAAMAEAEPEIVFHLAAQPLVRLSYDEPVETYDTNVMGTVHLLEAVRACPSVGAVEVVTSDKCYENRETGQAYREDDCMGGYDPYSSSKGCAELVTAAYRRSFFGPASATGVASVRAGNVIGGGDWAIDRIVPDCVRALQEGVPIVVRNPEAVRPWQHVLEPLSGYLHLASRMLASREFDGPWNFGPEQQGTVPVRRVADAIIEAWGSGVWESPGTKTGPHEATLLALDIGKAQKQLQWEPLYSVEQTLSITAAWYAARHEGADVRTLTEHDIEAYANEARRVDAIWAR